MTALAIVLGTPALPARADFRGHNGRLVFTRSGDLYSVLPDGTGLRRLTTTGGATGRWSPNGKQIAFERGGYIWIMSADGSHQRRLVPGWGPSWSPDGTRIAGDRTSKCDAFQDTIDRIFTVSVAHPSTKPHTISTYSICTSGEYVASAPRWLPDGSNILVTDVQASGDFASVGLDVVNVASGRRARTPFLTYCDYTGVSGCPLGNGRDLSLQPDFAPDGSAFVFVSDKGPVSGRTSIYTVLGRGGKAAAWPGTFYAFGPVWSPDGTVIAYTDRTPGQGPRIRFRALLSTAPSPTVIPNAEEPDWQP
jgi:Tol biopolymer transport system component